MRLLSRRPPPPSAPHPFAPPTSRPSSGPPREDRPVRPVTWTGGARLAATAATVALWALVGCGPIALLLVLLAQPDPAPPAAAPVAVADRSGEQAAAAEVAQRLVIAWLTTPRGAEEELGGLVDVTSLRLPQLPWQATDPAVAGLVEASPGVWSVTVSVTVTDAGEPDQDGEVPPGPVRRFFTVPVQVDPATGGAIAQALPAPVPAPPPPAAAPPSYGFTAPGSHPVAVTAADFLAALLTGTGDVARYLTPDAELRAITPPPYRSVTATEVRLDTDPDTLDPLPGTSVRTLVTATVATVPGQETTAQYALLLQARQGRWEVAQLAPAPAAGDSPDGTTAPPASPTPATPPTPPSDHTEGTPP